MPRGPKSKYTPELIELADRYLTDFKDEFEHEIPSIEGLAQVCNVHRETLYAWERDGDKPEISDTLRELRAIQKRIVLEKGLTGDYNPTITKLVLSANHGMHEKTEREHSGSLDLSQASDDQLKRRLSELGITADAG